MVESPEMLASVTELIDPAVAHMGDHGRKVIDQKSGERSAHPCLFRILLDGVKDGLVGRFNRLLHQEAAVRLLISVLLKVLEQRMGGKHRSFLSGRSATHSRRGVAPGAGVLILPPAALPAVREDGNRVGCFQLFHTNNISNKPTSTAAPAPISTGSSQEGVPPDLPEAFREGADLPATASVSARLNSAALW